MLFFLDLSLEGARFGTVEAVKRKATDFMKCLSEKTIGNGMEKSLDVIFEENIRSDEIVCVKVGKYNFLQLTTGFF